jgi:hypothetical protein
LSADGGDVSSECYLISPFLSARRHALFSPFATEVFHFVIECLDSAVITPIS